MDELEQININQALLWLGQSQRNLLGIPNLLKLHKKMFEDVWKWAGKYRTSEKIIGVTPSQIAIQIQQLLDNASFWIENDTYEWPELSARLHHKMVEIHPFANGNGRFARIWINEVLKYHGQPRAQWQLKLAPSIRRKNYLEALRKSDQKNHKDLISFMWD